MFDNISVLAGSKAIEIIRDEGLDLSRVKVLAGASGAAKFLVLTGIDRFLLSAFKDRTEPLHLLGTSIGAFRMVAYCQRDPLASIEKLEQGYIAQRYETKPTRQHLTEESWKILHAYIDEDDLDYAIHHPFMRLSFLASKCKGLLKYENRLLQGLGFALAAGVNRINRNGLGFFLERALFCTPDDLPPYAAMDQFPLEIHQLTQANLTTALLSSGSIPMCMEGISTIPGVPGVFRDGGVLDYHLDIPFLPNDDALVLYPHFHEQIIPGWLDKSSNRKPNPRNMENVVLVAPSKSFVAALPFGKIPDRKDFHTFFQRDDERIACWNQVVEKSKILGDELSEAIESGKIREIVKPL